MKIKYLIIGAITVWLGAYTYAVKAEAIASMPNQADGKIVLTNEICKDPATQEIYTALKRAYNYSASGNTSEGCYMIEDETVVVVWINTKGRSKSRYPIENFTLIKRNSTRGGV